MRPLVLLLVVYENVSDDAGVPLPPVPELSYAIVGAELPVLNSTCVTASGFAKVEPL